MSRPPSPEKNNDESIKFTILFAKFFHSLYENERILPRLEHSCLVARARGFPTHQKMVGITNWQQQVPVPQPYTVNNAWQIPLNPVPAKTPLTTKDRFLRGAIASAVNGVPIFNPLNNRGEDSFLIGELDEFGGHCRRADDYHYYIAPVHLENKMGKGLPIAYALDGYPIYGYGAPDDTKCFAINVWHIPSPGDVRSYWLLYNIPASVTEIPKSSRGIGIVGVNDKRRIEYDPMCSKGPGLKKYHITVYALSEELTLTPPQANRENLLSAIKDITLAEGTLDFQYERKR